MLTFYPAFLQEAKTLFILFHLLPTEYRTPSAARVLGLHRIFRKSHGLCRLHRYDRCAKVINPSITLRLLFGDPGGKSAPISCLPPQAMKLATE